VRIQRRYRLFNLRCESVELSFNSPYLEVMAFVDECNERGDSINQN